MIGEDLSVEEFMDYYCSQSVDGSVRGLIRIVAALEARGYDGRIHMGGAGHGVGLTPANPLYQYAMVLTYLEGDRGTDSQSSAYGIKLHVKYVSEVLEEVLGIEVDCSMLIAESDEWRDSKYGSGYSKDVSLVYGTNVKPHGPKPRCCSAHMQRSLRSPDVCVETFWTLPVGGLPLEGSMLMRVGRGCHW